MLLMTFTLGAEVVGCVTGIGDVDDDVPAVEAGVVTVPLVAAVVPVVEPVLVTVHTARNPVRGMEKSEWNLTVISLPEDWNGPGISLPQNFSENPS